LIDIKATDRVIYKEQEAVIIWVASLFYYDILLLKDIKMVSRVHVSELTKIEK
tara:strand:+ start:1907 stop:2065 length:159 start_codon:yes stop_codon:yes gene_type:complete